MNLFTTIVTEFRLSLKKILVFLQMLVPLGLPLTPSLLMAEQGSFSFNGKGPRMEGGTRSTPALVNLEPNVSPSVVNIFLKRLSLPGEPSWISQWSGNAFLFGYFDRSDWPVLHFHGVCRPQSSKGCRSGSGNRARPSDLEAEPPPPLKAGEVCPYLSESWCKCVWVVPVYTPINTIVSVDSHFVYHLV